MQFIQHYSSSHGNLYEVVSSNGERLLIDPGVTWKKIKKSLNYNLENIVGCLLSHAHFDHSKSAEQVMEAGINLYTSEETLSHRELNGRKSHVIQNYEVFWVGSFRVFPFKLIHDAPEPFGFIVTDTASDEKLFFATDTALIPQRFAVSFDIIAIECSWQRDLLDKAIDNGKLPQQVAVRLLNSHMEKKTTLTYLTATNKDGQKMVNLDKCREIHLLHCSETCLDKEQAAKDIEEATFLKTIIL